MVQINNVTISNDGLELFVDVQTQTGYNITSILLWNQDIYKKFDLKKDISFKLEQINNRESFSLTRDEANTLNFEGIWFLEIESNAPAPELCSTCNESQLVIVTNFNHIYRCMANLTNKIGTCSGNMFGPDSCCNPTEVTNLMTTHLLLEGVKSNLNIGEYAQAIELYKKAAILCKDCNPNGLISPNSPCLTCK